ncbi:MAG: DUF72 domain-containing protein [Tsuneonella sp.]
MEAIVGTAGWSIPAADSASFPADGTALERYSQVFAGVEVNSSFHRSHRPSTWARWADSVPAQFRFAVKIPKTITHQAKLVEARELTAKFVDEIAPLGRKLAVLLVQLPPKLGFDAEIARRFFAELAGFCDAALVCEPRNASWFTDEAGELLGQLRVARAAADPALCPAAAVPGGWRGVSYWRLHGSPAMYRSAYSDGALDRYADDIAAAVRAGSSAWCMFDNTAASRATGNALTLSRMLARKEKSAAAAVSRAGAPI